MKDSFVFNIAFFFIILFASWSMDSIRFRYEQSIYWRWCWLRQTRFFGWRDFWRSDQYSQFRKYKNGIPEHGRKKFLGIIIPQAFLDGWHFWKMILVGAIMFLVSANILQFSIFSVVWNLVWWLIYDINYKVKRREMDFYKKYIDDVSF